MTLCDVDEIHPQEGGLAFILGRKSPSGEGPQPQLHRFRPLAAKSAQLVALLADPDQVGLEHDMYVSLS